jgi:hypothetical protein
VTTVRAARRAFDLDSAAGRLLLLDAGHSTGLSLLAHRRREAWLARLRHRSLDARLAAGEPPECSRLLAVRAAYLVSATSRRRIAERWDALAALARRCLPRAQLEVADQIEEVADVLRADRRVGVRGVAVAVTMLGLAANAVQRPDTGGQDIAAAVARAAVMSCAADDRCGPGSPEPITTVQDRRGTR